MSRAGPDRRVEEILGSRGRVRLLQVLSENGGLNISEVSRRTGLNYTSMERHLVGLQRLRARATMDYTHTEDGGLHWRCSLCGHAWRVGVE